MGVISSYSGGGNYMDPSQRQFGITVTVSEGSLPGLAANAMEQFEAALEWHLGEVAQRVIDTARRWLVRLDEPPVKDDIHGYDTGLMYVSLKAVIVEELKTEGIFYRLFSEDADYWQYVEFGHWLRNGTFWPGYHFLEKAIAENAGAIRQAVREAWADAVVGLAAESRVPGLLGRLGF